MIAGGNIANHQEKNAFEHHEIRSQCSHILISMTSSIPCQISRGMTNMSWTCACGFDCYKNDGHGFERKTKSNCEENRIVILANSLFFVF